MRVSTPPLETAKGQRAGFSCCPSNSPLHSQSEYSCGFRRSTRVGSGHLAALPCRTSIHAGLRGLASTCPADMSGQLPAAHCQDFRRRRDTPRSY
jgi:hypothetical protein